MGWFGSKYSIKNREFHIKNKSGAKKGGRVTNAKTAYETQ